VTIIRKGKGGQTKWPALPFRSFITGKGGIGEDQSLIIRIPGLILLVRLKYEDRDGQDM
jgi:hypothetical protein